VPLRRFPYGLVFRCEGNVIRVVAVAHRRRRARYWTYRVQDDPRSLSGAFPQPPHGYSAP
jgi:hypothetical protein